MTRYFFSGGTMPSMDLLLHFQVRTGALWRAALLSAEAPRPPFSSLGLTAEAGCPVGGGPICVGRQQQCVSNALHTVLRCAAQDDVALERQWYINGSHYSRTLEAWLVKHDAARWGDGLRGQTRRGLAGRGSARTHIVMGSVGDWPASNH